MGRFYPHPHKTLWACDFFSKKVWTTKGFVEYFVLFFIQVGSRRVHIAGMTPNRNARWVGQQARIPDKPTYILRDYDAKFGEEFDAVFKAEDITVKKVGPVGCSQPHHNGDGPHQSLGNVSLG